MKSLIFFLLILLLAVCHADVASAYKCACKVCTNSECCALPRTTRGVCGNDCSQSTWDVDEDESCIDDTAGMLCCPGSITARPLKRRTSLLAGHGANAPISSEFSFKDASHRWQNLN